MNEKIYQNLPSQLALLAAHSRADVANVYLASVKKAKQDIDPAKCK